MVRYSVRHTLGLGRPARHKILPWLAVVIALVPAVVFVGLAVVLPFDLITDDILPDYHEYYDFITISLFFYCGIVVPDILVSPTAAADAAVVLVDPSFSAGATWRPRHWQ